MAQNGSLRLVLIGGSLRKQSVNAAVLATAAELAPPNARSVIYGRMADLPHFNPDDDRHPLPEPIADLREALARADALLLSTPEYAGSLPGSFKNLLDWAIGGSGLYRLPVGWINPSSHGGSKDTYAALRIVLERAGAKIVESACADVPVPREAVRPNGQIAAPQIRAVIGRVTSELLEVAKIQPELTTTRERRNMTSATDEADHTRA